MEHWFIRRLHASVNGQSVGIVWDECLWKYRKGSLPFDVTAALRSVDSADDEVVSTSSHLHESAMESKVCQDDDIDALLSAAGTFVSDPKTLASSVIGPHSAVGASPQLMGKNVEIVSQSQESSMNVASDAGASATSTAYSMPQQAAAAAPASSEFLSSM